MIRWLFSEVVIPSCSGFYSDPIVPEGTRKAPFLGPSNTDYIQGICAWKIINERGNPEKFPYSVVSSLSIHISAWNRS